MTGTPKASADWLYDLPLAPGPPDLRLGTRALDISTWLAADEHTPKELQLRRDILAQHGSSVARMVPGHEKGLEELLSLAEIHLGDRLDRSAGSPMEQLAVSAPDDVLVMWRDEKNWRLIGGALLFPNQWTLDDKIGKTLADIHGPVDGYDELLEARTDRFFDKLSPARPMARRNWFFHDDPTFFQPNRADQRAFRDPDDAAKLFVRSEGQALRRLAFSDLIIFTVKTQVAPISELKARTVVAEQMVIFLESASARSLENKDATARNRAIVDYLRS